MLRLDRAIKPWKESASLNDHINLYGFWNETTFLTKSGDLGIVLRVPGVDYESLDHSEQEYAVIQMRHRDRSSTTRGRQRVSRSMSPASSRLPIKPRNWVSNVL